MAGTSLFEIFISYRRDDSSGYAGRLHDALQAKYGKEHVFMDVATIEPGLDFLDAIERGIAKCDVFLPIIGRRWTSIQDAQGRPRLESPTDPVRLETEVALQRSDLRIVPVLVDGASMPAAEDLPESIAKLARRNAHELSHSRWHYDVEQLTTLIDKIRLQVVGDPSPSPVPPSSRRTKRKHFTWEEYARETPHAAVKMRLVRALAEQVQAATDWAMTTTSNSVVFRRQGEVALALQFWSRSEVRITVPELHTRPSPDPLPNLSGFLGKNGQWSWYVPVDSRAPDVSGVIRVAADRVKPVSALRTAANRVDALTPDGDQQPGFPNSSAGQPLAKQFEQDMYAAYKHLKTHRGYNATYFLRLLRERGGVGAAQRLLESSDHYSDGFLRLVELNQLEQSVEAHVLRPQYRELFSDRELAEARRRLNATGFDVDRWEDKPWT